MVDRPFIEPRISIELLVLVDKNTEKIDNDELRQYENNLIRRLTDVENAAQLERLDTVYIDKLKAFYPKHTEEQIKVRIDTSRETMTDEQAEEVMEAVVNSLTVLNTKLQENKDLDTKSWQMIARTEELVNID